ncbi:MAG: STAS domain-containing protein [Sedimentisphaerales bacterium]|nr:STAS domain-containing protein [Sedimentisphaerales bacterium]
MSDVDNNECVVTVDLAVGSKSLKELDALRKTVRRKHGCTVTVDFSKVDILASEAIMRLLELRDLLQKRNGRLILCGVSQPTMNIFAVTGLDHVFEFSCDKALIETCAPSQPL